MYFFDISKLNRNCGDYLYWVVLCVGKDYIRFIEVNSNIDYTSDFAKHVRRVVEMHVDNQRELCKIPPKRQGSIYKIHHLMEPMMILIATRYEGEVYQNTLDSLKMFYKNK